MAAGLVRECERFHLEAVCLVIVLGHGKEELPLRVPEFVLEVLLQPGGLRAIRSKPSTDYFPPPESKGGWRSALPAKGPPDAAALDKLGIDAAKLAEAWEYNAMAEGATGLLVIRHGQIVGEWYRGCDPTTKFNIYSSSKAYTSLAFGLLLADSEAGKLPGAKKLGLDTKVCNEEWLPEALPLPDARKANITVRHLLNMASGSGPSRCRPRRSRLRSPSGRPRSPRLQS